MEDFNKIHKKYKRYIQTIAINLCINEHFDDMVQEGFLGLWEAYQRYDESKGPFKNYAIGYIKGYMLKFLDKNARTIYIPTNKLRAIRNEEFVSTTNTVSINTPINESNSTLEDFITEEVEEPYFDGDIIKNAVMELNEKDRILIQKTYGFHPYIQMTCREIAAEYGTSHQAVNQKVMRIQKILKKKLEGKV